MASNSSETVPFAEVEKLTFICQFNSFATNFPNAILRSKYCSEPLERVIVEVPAISLRLFTPVFFSGRNACVLVSAVDAG